MSLPCVVLGGGEGVLVDPAAPFKGMARVAGRPMIEWVLEALREAGTIGEITAVVPRRIDSEPWPALTDGIVVSDATFIENVLAGLARYGDDERVLVVTSDVPAITPGAIDSFVLESLRGGPTSPTRSWTPRTWRRRFQGRSGRTSASMGAASPAATW